MNASATLCANPIPARNQNWTDPTRSRFAVHGPVVELENHVPALDAPVRRLLGQFGVAGWPDGFAPVHGTVRPYEQSEVLRHLSPTARALPSTGDLADLFHEGERFWLVDDRWGMVEVNFLKAQWRSWVLPRPQLDPVRCAEMAVLWPLAQLLRPRGVHLLPAASAVRNGWAFLIICPFGVVPELTALIGSGYRIVGQRWTAVREEEGRLALLHMPGLVERGSGALPPSPGRVNARAGESDRWSDINDRSLGAWQHHAFCDAVLVADPGRRAHAGLEALDPAEAASLLRRAWPIVELHPSRRHSALPSKLAERCRCAELQLSRNPGELLPLLDAFRETRAIAA